eukprot:GDKJ01017846.1.p1 GENE.GDKJ01017846.1~~GDKJ01017846.1.p1  ORF type:complete len:619 (+),score=121.88 GDKJ01017846.1:21-1877(+)
MQGVEKSLKTFGSVQLPLKCVSFVLNILVTRFADPEAFGIANVSFYLFSMLIIALPKESFKRAALRSLDKSENEITDAIACIMRGTVFGLLLIPSVVFFTFFASNLHLNNFQVIFSISSLVAASLFDLLSEILFVWMSHHHNLHFKYISDTLGLLARSLSCIFLLKLQADPILPFAFSPLIHSVISCLYLIAAIYRLEDSKMGISALLSTMKRASQTKSSLIFFLPSVSAPRAKLEISFLKNTLFKMLMQESDKFVLMYLFDSSGSVWGEYALVSSLGAIVARLVFSPLEDLVSTSLSKLEANANGPAVMKMANAFVRITSWLGICCAAIGPPFSHLVLFLLYGQKWVSPSTSTGERGSAGDLLSWYCYYILIMAINGVFEAVVSARMDAKWMGGRMMKLNFFAWMCFYFSVAFLLLVVRVENGAKVIIVSQMFSMSVRILNCVIYVLEKEGGWESVKILLFGDENGRKSTFQLFLGGFITFTLVRAFFFFFTSSKSCLSLIGNMIVRGDGKTFSTLMSFSGVGRLFQAISVFLVSFVKLDVADSEGISNESINVLWILLFDVGILLFFGLSTLLISYKWFISVVRSFKVQDDEIKEERRGQQYSSQISASSEQKKRK